MIEFRMPSLGADMELGTVIEWLVKPGDVVKRGDIVAVVDTDKAEVEIEIWNAGVVKHLRVSVGEEVPVGTVLAELEAPAESQAAPALESATRVAAPPRFSEPEPEPAREPVRRPAPQPMHAPAERETPPRVGSVVRASPLARRLAQERNLDLSQVSGTGPGGAITKSDIESLSGGAADAPQRASRAESSRPPLDREASMRQAIARAMERSKREIPHYYLETTIDFQAAQSWLTAENERRHVTERMLPSVLLLKATALALAAVPELNGHWIDGAFRPCEAKHLGMAIALRHGGLLAPAILDVERKDLDTLMHDLRDLVNRTRNGKLRGSEVSQATATVTSLGDMGVEKVYGVIYPPQVALIGFGRIAPRPWAEDGMLGVRPVVSATLAADHRASDGARGAKFLAALTRHLAHPETL